MGFAPKIQLSFHLIQRLSGPFDRSPETTLRRKKKNFKKRKL
jgi:hypothetical protein